MYTFAHLYWAYEKGIYQLAKMLGLFPNQLVAKCDEAIILERMELISSNIEKCETLAEVKACEDAIKWLLVVPYEDYRHMYYPTLIESCNRATKRVFNQSVILNTQTSLN